MYGGTVGEKIKICEGGSAKFSIPPPSQDFKWNSPYCFLVSAAIVGVIIQYHSKQFQTCVDHHNIIGLAGPKHGLNLDMVLYPITIRMFINHNLLNMY